MKKVFFFAATLAALASCSTEGLVDDWAGAGKDGAISFVMQNKNMTRSYQDMQKVGHYNFGVFAYKSTDQVIPVMPNYLVGYYDDNLAYQQSGTTVGDQAGIEDGKSYWMYEGMGNTEYNGTYAGGALTDAFKSNNANQFLKFWDNAAASYCFYAYAPYINGTGTATYVDGTAQAATGDDKYVLNIPNGTLTDGYDDPALAEYMYAVTKVEKANYGHDVPLNFHRLNAKVNIKFWEDVPGYKVRILNLSETYNEGVYAAASIKEPGKGNFGYKGGKYYTANGVKIQFNNGAYDSMKQYEGTLAKPTAADGNNPTPLKFKAPTEAAIGEYRYAAAESPTTYYAIPKGDGANVLADGNMNFATDQACDADLALTGFTFHVSYELTAEDTGERIVVNNATVHVPAEYCNWKNNTHYTYIFKITRNTNGSTLDPSDPNSPIIDPTNPEVPEVQALYPIVFDNCTVEDWDEVEGEWNISDDANLIYHDVQLSTYSLKNGTIDVTVTDHDTYAGHGIDYTKISLAGPDLTNVTYDNATHQITVAAGAAAGVYTVTYTCPATPAQATHPQTWTEHFVVGNEYTIDTHRDVIGTNSNNASAKLNITGKMDGSATTLTAANLKIHYPDNFKTPDFSASELEILKDAVQVVGTDVVVKNNALPGVYKVVYTVDEGSKVKVAEKEFTVKDYSLTLDHTTVFNTDGGTVVKGNQVADANHVYTSETGSVSGNAITVANNTAEGTYTVTYTVYGGEDDETVYTQTFTVKNQYAVTLGKDNIDSMVGTAATGDVSTDGILVTLKNNGVTTDTDLTGSLKVVAADAANTATADDNFSFVWDDTAKTITLKVKRGAAKKQYKVVYTGQTDVYVVANFVVK